MHAKIVERYAPALELPRNLIHAVIRVESGGNTWAWNPEPHYRWLVDAATGEPFRALTAAERETQKPPDDFPSCPGLPDDRDAEWWGQQASWGLMQVMGAVAREHGFRGWHPELCDPEVGVKYGCVHLRWLADRHQAQYGWPGVLRAYNTGSAAPGGAGDVYLAKVSRVSVGGIV